MLKPLQHTDMISSIRGLMALIFFVLSPAFYATQAQNRPNILWITTEDMSPALGSYGDAYATTPYLDGLAARGVRYTQAYASAPICAPARSTLITGVHATSLSTQHLRSEGRLPETIRTLPEYLREAGYYTTNNSKTDYNFSAEGRWNENGSEAHWRNRPDNTPFFSVFNIMTTHEGPINNSNESYFDKLAERHNPAEAALPPYFPDTPEMRRIWARMYDLITVMDGQVGALLEQLEADGLADNTIIFFFSDHGHGLPRYKRWAYRTGYHVPLIIYAPPKFQDVLPVSPGTSNDDIVSFVDYAPTVLSLAGLTPPDHMQGHPFLGANRNAPRTHFVGGRSRADDVYDLSRTVIDDRYVYIRNYMPYKSYIQEALIFGDQKASYAELHRVRADGGLPQSGKAMFQPRPHEELYDILEDPYELVNLANAPEHTSTLQVMRSRLASWIEETRDAGFLNEAEVMLRAASHTPYEVAQDSAQYDLSRIMEAAEWVGRPERLEEAMAALSNPDSGVRYWAVLTIQSLIEEGLPEKAIDLMKPPLKDDNPVVAVAAAETYCIASAQCDQAHAVLLKTLADERSWLALQAAISMRRLGTKACPVKQDIHTILKQNLGTAMGRYKNWMYPMFLGFALDQVLLTCGVWDENPLG